MGNLNELTMKMSTNSIDYLRKYSLSLPVQKGEECDARLLREVPGEEGDEGRQGDNHEKWQACNTGCLSDMWYQNVPHRKRSGAFIALM